MASVAEWLMAPRGLAGFVPPPATPSEVVSEVDSDESTLLTPVTADVVLSPETRHATFSFLGLGDTFGLTKELQVHVTIR